jgi:hypothetical protein
MAHRNPLPYSNFRKSNHLWRIWFLTSLSILCSVPALFLCITLHYHDFPIRRVDAWLIPMVSPLLRHLPNGGARYICYNVMLLVILFTPSVAAAYLAWFSLRQLRSVPSPRSLPRIVAISLAGISVTFNLLFILTILLATICLYFEIKV